MTTQASVSFSGVSNIRQVRFPFSRGVLPSTGFIYCPATPGTLDAGGDLTFSFGGNSFTFTDCQISSCHMLRHHDGLHPTRVIAFKDRRWRWSKKTVSGDWNRRLSDGTVDPLTRLQPSGLASQILNAMGEGGYDVSRMPTGVYPPGKWDNERADIALQRLCDYVACEVVLNPTTNLVEIWPLGTGGSTVEGVGELYPKYRHVPRAGVPSTVRVNCGPSVWQSKLALRAVARNYNTSTQYLLSTLGTTFIENESPLSLPSVTDNNLRALGFEQYLRLFEVIGQQGGSLAVPNCPIPITSTDQYLLNDYVLETETDLYGFKHNLSYYIDGDYWPYSDTLANVTSQRYTGDSRLHKDRKCVQFPVPMIKFSSSGAYGEPTMYLTTSYRVRDVYGQVAGLYRYGSVGGSGGELVLSRPEIFSVYSTSTTPGAQTNTESQAIAEADLYVQMFLQKYANPIASEITYPGLLSGSLDGNIAQITWEYSVNYLPRTIVCEGEELDISAPSSAERRRML